MSNPKELNEKNQGIQHSTNSHVEPKKPPLPFLYI